MPTLTFQRKLWIPFLCSLLCISAIFLFDALQLRAVRMEERRTALAEINHAALNAVRRLGEEAAAGRLSLADAQQQAKAVVGSLRYGKDSYVSILRDDGGVVQNPGNPAANGKNMIDFQDPSGKYLFREIVQLAATSGQGYVDFMWLRPGAEQPSSKLAYISSFKPWGWVLLTGVYTDDINTAFRDSLLASALMMLIVAGVLVLISVLINRSLNALLGGAPEYAMQTAQRIAANDLSVAVSIAPGDRSSLLCAMATMQRNLATALGDIRGSASAIASASSQIAAGNLDLSTRTESQASALEETAASMEQLTTAVAQNADSALQANQLAQSAAQVAAQGGAAMARVLQTMGDISAASARIVDIIGVIDGIAFQTNILALNAAVEAARAGDQGRGFAVVASEVRNLAHRSAAAAKEVKTLIDNSVQRIASGDQQVLEASGTMRAVVHSIDQVTALLGEITAASQEQRAGIGQVNQAVGAMDAVTQQNAALVEQAAAAAASLQDQAGELDRLVQRFRLTPRAAAATTHPPRTRLPLSNALVPA